MNARQVKKLRQLAHRAAAQPIQAMRTAEQAHLTRLQELAHVPVRPAPWLVPARLWAHLQTWIIGAEAWALLNPQAAAMTQDET